MSPFDFQRRFSKECFRAHLRKYVVVIQTGSWVRSARSVSGLDAEFDSLQTQIEEMVSESDLESQLSQRYYFEDSYYNVLTRAKCILGNQMVSF
jgi:hypothetical protein